MDIVVMLGAALMPAILLWLYIWRKDPKPEPLWWMLKATLTGIVICVPVGFVEMVMMNTLFGGRENPASITDAIAEAFTVPALTEESFKLLALWHILRKNPHFDEHFDGIVYAVCVGLGFAMAENVSYVFESEEWLKVAVMRALLSVPGHYAFAILMGYYYSVYHFVNRSLKNAVCVLLVPVMAHGIYDGIVMSSSVNPYLGTVCFMVLIWFCIKMHKMAKSKVLVLIDRDNAEA